MVELAHWQERVVKEADELKSKIDKLVAYLGSDKSMLETHHSAEFLQLQLTIMNSYMRVLELRIKEFTQ